MRRFCLLILCLSLCYLSACEKAPSATSVTKPLHLSPIPCRYRWHKQVRYKCYLASRTDGVKHSYYVSILSLKTKPEPVSNEAKTPEAKKRQAIVAIPGGPGQGEQTEQDWILSWSDIIAENNIPIDLVVFDPPATLGSSAFWNCPEYDVLALRLAAENLSYTEELEKLVPVFDDCLVQYHRELIDSGFSDDGLLSLSSEQYAQRFGMLMDALPYEDFHLLGTSYGTRLALLAAEHPHVATLTLDSVYPFSRGTLLDVPSIIAHADQLHRQHHQTLMNHKVSYDELFKQAVSLLEENPQTWNLSRWDGESNVRFVLNASRLYDVAFSVLYDETMLEFFYTGLNNIHQYPDELRWVLEDYVTNAYDPSFSTMLFAATECADNKKVAFENYMQETKKFPMLKEDWEQIYEQDICRHALFSQAQPLNNNEYPEKHTLVFSGELDPVTPTFWAQELIGKIPMLQVVTVGGVGHAVLASEQCQISDLIDYWESRDASTVIRCKQKMPELSHPKGNLTE